MFTIKIKDKQIYTDENMPKANELYVMINSLIPNEKAEFLIDFRNKELGSLYQRVYAMEGEDYQKWNDDLPYLENWVLTITGTTRRSEN